VDDRRVLRELEHQAARFEAMRSCRRRACAEALPRARLETAEAVRRVLTHTPLAELLALLRLLCVVARRGILGGERTDSRIRLRRKNLIDGALSGRHHHTLRAAGAF